MSSKRKFLTLEQRVEVLKKLDKGLSVRKVAEELNCGKTQISNIKADRVQILSQWEAGGRSTAKCVKKRKGFVFVLNTHTCTHTYTYQSKAQKVF
jgi:DNA-binding NarL/FixJ family response regulator